MLLPSFRSHQYEPLIQDTDEGKKKVHHAWYIALVLATLSGLSIAAWQITSSRTAFIEQIYYIPEEEWHTPADVNLKPDDPLWKSRYDPFFHEVDGNIHKALGYGSKEVNLDHAHYVRRSVYRHLLQSFQSFSIEHDFHWWIAHGTLLGQRWGQKIMTGDTDIDVQCSLAALHRVRKYQKQIHQDRFMLLVNPHYIIRKSRNKPDWKHDMGVEANVIDARWLDFKTGYFIDITALSSAQSSDPQHDVAPFEGEKEARILQDKTPHASNASLINPQRRCKFEGLDLWCPNGSEEMLRDEYETYDQHHFHVWRFNETIQTFELITCPRLVSMFQHPTLGNCDSECRDIVSNDRTFTYTQNGEECVLNIHWTARNGTRIEREYKGSVVSNEHVNLDVELHEIKVEAVHL